jgi:hypothetical protein
MKITKKYLQQIIKEEVLALLGENSVDDEFEQDVLDCAKDENKCRQDNPKFLAAVKAKVKELFGDQLGKSTVKKIRARDDKTDSSGKAGNTVVDRKGRMRESISHETQDYLRSIVEEEVLKLRHK